jgi:hypothetical protein
MKNIININQYNIIKKLLNNLEKNKNNRNELNIILDNIYYNNNTTFSYPKSNKFENKSI